MAQSASAGGRAMSARVLVLAGVMAVAAVPLFALALRRPIAVAPTPVPWWVIALGFLASETLVVELQVRRDSHKVSLSEIPFLFGLAAAGPVALFLGRLLGTAAAFAPRPSQTPTKITFNLCLAGFETALGLAMYRYLLGGSSQVSALGLAVGVAALVTTLVASGVMVALALQLTQQGRRFTSIIGSFGVGLAVSLVATATAALGLALFWREPASVLAVAAGSVALYGALKGYGTLSRKYEELQAVNSFTSAIDGAADMDALIDATLASTQELFDAGFVEVVLSQGVGSTATWRGDDGAVARRPAPPAVLESLSGDGDPAPGVMMLTDAPVEVRSHYDDRGVATAMLAELRAGVGTDALVVVGNRRGGRPFTADDRRLLGLLVRQARVSFDRGRLVDRLRREVSQKEHQALHDALTGLPNRLHFNIVVEEALRSARDGDHRVAVLLVDLDRFKEVNDTLGHQRGDVLLQEMALRLAEEVGGDHMARLGGDEFGVLLREVSGVNEAAEWATKLGDVLRRPFVNEGLVIQVSGSVGIAIAPDHGTDGETLLRRADVAMYEAKEHGSTFEVYDPRRDGYSTRRLALAAELRDAIESGALAVHYQPKVAMSDGTVVGVEALVRWIHPRHGVIPPDDFIGLAEKTGLIGPLTEHVMRVAFRDRARLVDEGHRLSVAVNVATPSLSDVEFPNVVARLIAEFDVDPQGVILEVTESTMMGDSARTRLVLADLDEIGVGIAIDDFGTGYSSLSHLSTLPVDEVKIDRSFVMDMAVDERLAKIVTSTTGLVHSLGLRVVAEGIENRGTWDLLTQAGCDVAQGFYIAKPMGFTDLGAWLNAGAEFVGDSGPRLPGLAAAD